MPEGFSGRVFVMKSIGILACNVSGPVLSYPADVRGRVFFASRETVDNTPGGPRMYFSIIMWKTPLLAQRGFRLGIGKKRGRKEDLRRKGSGSRLPPPFMVLS